MLTQVVNIQIGALPFSFALWWGFFGWVFVLFCLYTRRTSSCQRFFLGLNWKISTDWLTWNV